jgi:hypothetical protein
MARTPPGSGAARRWWAPVPRRSRSRTRSPEARRDAQILPENRHDHPRLAQGEAPGSRQIAPAYWEFAKLDLFQSYRAMIRCLEGAFEPTVQAVHGLLAAIPEHRPLRLRRVAIMRALVLGIITGVALATSPHAAPLSPNLASIELGATPPIELVSEGCGWGWHRVRWQDHWGYWHSGHCVPYGHIHGHGGRFDHPYADWRGPTGGWGNP